MKTRADDPPPGEERDQGWDETVLVWNATVVRIPAPAARPGAADEAAAGRRRPNSSGPRGRGRHRGANDEQTA
jgi:hypothetical protein